MKKIPNFFETSAANFQPFADLISPLISKVTKLPSLAYQDDLILIAQQDKLSEVLDVLDEFFIIIGIKFDFSKRVCGESVDSLGKKITLKQGSLWLGK